ncbi:DUF6415 family natural product biosynthesis protein [Streptomyces sp. NPDC026672]|uniref:DUF6415 family natural product biosynthesis protein n=1 Tax=unclassified Streptomyces TaxID=2593676 RepID=UPI00340BA2FD
MQGTHRPPSVATVDLLTIRRAARHLVRPDDGPEALPPSAAELDQLMLQIPAHLGVLMSEVQRLAERFGEDSILGYGALVTVDGARKRLDVDPGPELLQRVVHARRLARSLQLLARYYEVLS